jgi:hypothetical protein
MHSRIDPLIINRFQRCPHVTRGFRLITGWTSSACKRSHPSVGAHARRRCVDALAHRDSNAIVCYRRIPNRARVRVIHKLRELHVREINAAGDKVILVGHDVHGGIRM